MLTRFRAFVARRRIPRCWQCGALVDARPSRWLARYVCEDPECREASDLEMGLGL